MKRQSFRPEGAATASTGHQADLLTRRLTLAHVMRALLVVLATQRMIKRSATSYNGHVGAVCIC